MYRLANDVPFVASVTNVPVNFKRPPGQPGANLQNISNIGHPENFFVKYPAPRLPSNPLLQ